MPHQDENRPLTPVLLRTCYVRNCLNALLCSYGSCSKSFWDLPLVEGPGRHVHPKTTTFCLVLGFTTSGRPSRAHQSQNDLEQDPPAVGAEPSGTFVVLFLFCLPLSQSLVAHSSGLFGTSRPVFPLSVFLTCNVGMKIGIPCTFSSGRVTSGNCQPALQAPLQYFRFSRR